MSELPRSITPATIPTSDTGETAPWVAWTQKQPTQAEADEYARLLAAEDAAAGRDLGPLHRSPVVNVFKGNRKARRKGKK